MRLYPELPSSRTRAIAADILTLALVAFFAWAGIKVHDTVLTLNSISRGVQDAGTSINDGFGTVAGAVGSVPIIGGALSDSLKEAAGATGGNVVQAGRAGEAAVNDTANVLGWVTFLLPTIVLLAFAIPIRVRQILKMTDAEKVLGRELGHERRRLLAMRAAFGLPWADLKPYTEDPIGDLEAGRYEPLVAALYAQAGLRPPAAQPGPAG